MAIYHLTAKVISRARGERVVSSAASRSGTTLFDHRYGLTHNFARKRVVAHAQILAPEGAPAWVLDRETLWNRVEEAEIRKDSQLARAIDVGLPIELSTEEGVSLVIDYARQEFVAKGMIADVSVRRDNPDNPHAHLLLTLRAVGPQGFGPKERRWNTRGSLHEWRAAWAQCANEHLARAGHGVRIDHRTLEAQQIELQAARNIGLGRGRRVESALPEHLSDRMLEQRRIAFENGVTILEDPTVALRALSHQRTPFSHKDLFRFLRTRTQGKAQFDAAFLAVMQSRELVRLTAQGVLPALFTTRDMQEAEKSLQRRAAAMRTRRGHGVTQERRGAVLTPARATLSAAQLTAFEEAVADGDVKALAMPGGAERLAVLALARQAWQLEGLIVTGAALSKRAVDALESSAGIAARTLVDCEASWLAGTEFLTRDSVFVVDEAELIGLKQLERALGAADRVRAKIVLVGDPGRLKDGGTDSPFCAVAAEAQPSNTA